MPLYDKKLVKHTRFGDIELHFQSIAGTELNTLPEFTVTVKRPDMFKRVLGLELSIMEHVVLNPRALCSVNSCLELLESPSIDENIKHILIYGMTEAERRGLDE